MQTFAFLREADRPAIIVDLPANNPAWARAAFEAGADAIRVHINQRHRAGASGSGRLSEERAALEEILFTARGLVGLAPGDAPETSGLDLTEAESMGFHFVSAKVGQLPATAAKGRLPLIPSVDRVLPEEAMRFLGEIGAAAVIAAITPPEQLGRVMTLERLLDLRTLAARSPVPVIVPTQCALTPSDLPALKSAGMSGLLLTRSVVGDSTGTIIEGIRRFRRAIDGL